MAMGNRTAELRDTKARNGVVRQAKHVASLSAPVFADKIIQLHFIGYNLIQNSFFFRSY